MLNKDNFCCSVRTAGERTGARGADRHAAHRGAGVGLLQGRSDGDRVL